MYKILRTLKYKTYKKNYFKMKNNNSFNTGKCQKNDLSTLQTVEISVMFEKDKGLYIISLTQDEGISWDLAYFS